MFNNLKTISKKIATILLSAVIGLSSIVPAFALSVGSSITPTVESITYCKTIKKLTYKSGGDVYPIYCIDYDKTYYNESKKLSDLESSSVWKNLSDSAKKGIALARYYGGGVNCSNVSYYATQIIIWEYQTGQRTNYSSSLDSSKCGSTFQNYIVGNQTVYTRYKEILGKMKKFSTDSNKPSFDDSTVTVSKSGSAYSKTLTDKNKISHSYSYSYDTDYLSVKKSDDTVTVYAKKPFTGTKKVTATLDTTSSPYLLSSGKGQYVMYGRPGISTKASFYVSCNEGVIKIVKENSSDETKVSNFSFEIYNSANKKVASGKTNANGTLAANLTAGTYTVKELTANGYKAVSNKSVTVKAGETATVKFVNSYDLGSIKIRKTSTDGVVANIPFKLTGTDIFGNKIEKNISTDSNGYATFNNLTYGNYIVSENLPTNIANQYNPVLSQPVTINASNKNIDLTSTPFHNVRKEVGVIVVNKFDSKTNIPITKDGFTFKIKNVDTGEYLTLYDDAGNLTNVFKTKNGSWHSENNQEAPFGKNIINVPDGRYQLEEITAPSGYIFNNYKSEILTLDSTIEENQMITFKVKNDPQLGQIKIIKTGDVFHSVSENNNIYSPVYKNTGLANVTFNVYANENIYNHSTGKLIYEKDDLVTVLVTDSNGEAVTGEIELGRYYLKEVSAPRGYIIDDTKNEVNVTANGMQQVTLHTLTVNNTKQNVKISLKKVLETDRVFNIGFSNEFKSVVFGLFAAESLVANNGDVVPQDGLIELSKPNSNGSLIFNTDIPEGKYYIKEISTSEKYILDNTSYVFDYSYNDDNLINNIISVNDGEEITNSIYRGNIYGNKYDEYGHSVQGAIIGLFNENETVFTEETALRTSTSDESGSFVFESIPKGKWIIREISAPVHFVLNEDIQTVEVTDSDEYDNSIDIINKHIKGDLIINKINDENIFVPNCIFAAYVDENQNGKYEEDTDYIIDYGKSSEELINDKLLLDLLYLKHNESTGEDSLTKSEYIKYLVGLYADLLNIDNSNNHIEDNIDVTQSPYNQFSFNNALTEEVLLNINNISNKGSAFSDRIYDYLTWINNLSSEMLKLEYKDKYIIPNLNEGKYLITEIISPVNYVPNNTYYAFEINKDAKQVYLSNVDGSDKFVNKFIKGSIKVIKTNDSGELKLKGAEFTLTDENGNVLSVKSTDENGELIFNDVKYGKYYVYESKSPKGYQVDKTPQVAFVSTDQEIIELSFKNDIIPKKEKTPYTGEVVKYSLIVGLIFLSGITGIIYSIHMKKKEQIN